LEESIVALGELVDERLHVLVRIDLQHARQTLKLFVE
jgi:hypothetical protein